MGTKKNNTRKGRLSRPQKRPLRSKIVARKFPANIDLEFQRAIHHHHLGQLSQAEKICETILKAAPTHAYSLYLLGVVDHSRGRMDTAVKWIKKAISNDPANSDFYNALGRAYHDQGKLTEAISCYRQVIRLNPEDPEAYYVMGMAYRDQDKLDEAITCYQKALNLDPSLVKAHYHMGYSLQDQGKLDKAIACYRNALELQPDPGVEVQTCLVDPIIFDSADSIHRRRSDMVRALDSLRKKGIRLEDPHKQVGRANFYLAYQGLNNRELQEKIASFYLSVCPELAWEAPHCNRQRKRKGKVRLGIISRFLYNHTIGRLAWGVVRHLSREKFHVTVFQFLDNNDPLSQSIRSEADSGVTLSNKLASARHELAQQALDILLYLDIGMDSLTYFLAFSRLARIQCVTWGHPDTTGIPNIDYFLSSEHAEPPDGQSHYTERLIRLKGFPMYCRRPEPPTKVPSRQAFGLSEDMNLYVCVQSLFKVHPDFDKILRDLLCRDSRAMLVFFELENRHVTRLLRDRFAQAFPGEIERVRFQPRLSFEEFLSLLTLADVVLDTPHFNGGYTSLLCFAAGIPVVTWPGRFMRGRLTLGFYKQMGVADCVTNNAQAYADIALQLANDRTWRKQVQETIRKRVHVLYEDIEAVRDLERFLEWAIQHHGQKHPASSGAQDVR